MHRVQIIDSHTGGEPTRLVIGGFPDLGSGSMADRRALLASQFDHWRRATVNEPRGNDVIVGALLCAPVDPQCAAGVVFFNNEGYLGMCGHGTIGLITSLAHMERIGPGAHFIETPVGKVMTTLHVDGSVSVRNVPSYRSHADVCVDVPGFGTVTGDVAWGGNWFFLISDHGLRVAADNIAVLTDFAWRARKALQDAGVRGTDGAVVDHVELFADDPDADSRSFVLCPGGAYDRSPCGTGTSAKLSCLAARGKLEPGSVWRQASVIGSQFQAHYELDSGVLIPTIRGTAHICAETTLLIDEKDPFAWGIPA